jgi:hypothetical protein
MMDNVRGNAPEHESIKGIQAARADGHESDAALSRFDDGGRHGPSFDYHAPLQTRRLQPASGLVFGAVSLRLQLRDLGFQVPLRTDHRRLQHKGRAKSPDIHDVQHLDRGPFGERQLSNPFERPLAVFGSVGRD